MKIDPHAWLLTTPLTIAIIQVYFLPANHAVRRLWRYLAEVEAIAWERLGWAGHPLQISQRGLVPKTLLGAVCAALAMSSIASFAAFVSA